MHTSPIHRFSLGLDRRIDQLYTVTLLTLGRTSRSRRVMCRERSACRARRRSVGRSAVGQPDHRAPRARRTEEENRWSRRGGRPREGWKAISVPFSDPLLCEMKSSVHSSMEGGFQWHTFTHAVRSPYTRGAVRAAVAREYCDGSGN